ncbi:hypothetical protein QYM36_016532 [Artemia franciscana]|uniref:Uncharacterized protein n=1 Tax=Artemia franciscana TaxID=6661 RepID=A0AA88HIY1_ARTSF|nr:hypothetical protein QYM36_016532 [Artemia franciscana]
MVIKNFITCTSVACAGISIWFAVRKYGYFKRDSGEDRNFRPKKKSKLIPVDEDKTITVLASMVGAGSEEHIQIEEDIKLDIVAPMQSDNRKNSQTIINNDIHQSPPYNADSVSSLHHAAKVVSKQLEESPADVQSSMEFPLNLTEPIPEQPSLVNGVTEEPMVPEKHLEEPAPKQENPSIKSVCPCNEGPLNPEGKKRDNTKLKNKYKLNVKRMYKQLADIQEENESNSIDDSPLEFPLIEITQQEKSSVKSVYTSKEGPLNPESEKRYDTGFLKIFKSNVKTVYKQLVAEHDLRVKQYCPVPETSGAVSKVLIPKPETAEREKPSEGQWRPLNFGGKKRYDTNFLEMFNSNLKRRYKQLAAEDDLKVSKLPGKVHYPVRIS